MTENCFKVFLYKEFFLVFLVVVGYEDDYGRMEKQHKNKFQEYFVGFCAFSAYVEACVVIIGGTFLTEKALVTWFAYGRIYAVF